MLDTNGNWMAPVYAVRMSDSAQPSFRKRMWEQCILALHKLLCTGKMSIQTIHTSALQTFLSECKETFHKREAHASCSLSVALFHYFSLCVHCSVCLSGVCLIQNALEWNKFRPNWSYTTWTLFQFGFN